MAKSKPPASPSASATTSSSPTDQAVAKKPAPGVSRAAQAVTAVEMGSRQREISVSEFFTKNRHLLGFDNPRKALLTCVKEAVDNALDACEEAGILPDVLVKIEVASNGETLPPASQASRFRITVADNGPGIVREQVPKIFAKLLYGSKFHRLRMSRGQQGIGISAAGMYGQLTTGKPVKIISRTSPRSTAHYFEVQIDTKKNEPLILEKKQIDWDQPRGTQVTLEVEGRYQKGRASVDEYVELMNNLHLPNPKMMDVAVPANMRIGLAQQIAAGKGWAIGADQAKGLLGQTDVTLIDLREDQERRKHGVIPGSVHVPYQDVEGSLKDDGLLAQLAKAAGKRLVFYCAFGERSAMAVQAAQAAGLASARHIHGGLQAWQQAGGPLNR